MQTIVNENVQTFANYANKSPADTNATKTPKEQMRDMKKTQTAAHEKNSNLTCQVINTIQYYPRNNNRQGGWYNRINEKYRDQNNQQGGIGGRGNKRGNNRDYERGYFNLRKSAKMNTVGHVDGKQTTNPPNVSDILKAMSQARTVPIQRMAEIGTKGGTDGPGDMH